MATSITNTSVTTDNLTVDTSTLYVDAANNRVGVGTTTPTQATLHVSGGGVPARFEGNTGTTYVQFGASGTTNYGQVAMTGNNMTLRTSYVDRMTIDSSGYVTMPNQPKFYVKDLNFPESNASGTASGGTVEVNIGNHYNSSNGRFTAPIAGTYQFIMMTQAYDSGNTTGQYQTAVFRKNGSNFGGESYHGWAPNDGNNHVQANNTIIATLAAGDYVQAYVQYGSRDIQNYFGGFLIG